jgi:hypothetical protein
MTSFPIFALIVHVVTIVMIFGSGVNRKFRPGVGLIAGLVSTYIVCLVSLSDYEIYAGIYKSINPDEPFLDQLPFLYGEPLYLLSNYVARLFSDSFYSTRFLLIFAALVIKMMFLFRFGKYYSVSIVFYMSLLFYADSYLLRSTIASSFILLALWGLLTKRPAYRFFMFILIGSGFHTSALIALPIWFLRNFVISKQTGFIILAVILGLAVFPIGHLMVNFLASFISSDVLIINKLVGYADQIYGNSAGVARGSLLIYFSVAVLFIGLRDSISKMTPHFDFIALMVLYSLALLVGFSDFEVLSDRLFRLACFFIAVAFGYIISCFDRKSHLLIVFSALFCLNVIPYITYAGPFALLK